MNTQLLKDVRWGLAMSLLCLLIGVGLGVSFGLYEDSYQNYISAGIAAHPELHDAISQNSIWRWVLRAHFHAAGIGAFLTGLVVVVALSDMGTMRKQATAICMGLGGLYPMAWFSMFLLAPALGRKAAKHHWLVELLTYVSIGGFLLGMLSLLVGLFLGRQRKS